MDEYITIEDYENSFISDLNELGDWFLQYEYLMRISAELPRIEDEKKTSENRVKGCQSAVWLDLHSENGRISVRADSDSLIIRGMIAITVFLLDGRLAEEIISYVPRYIEETNIKKQISTDRFHGLNSVIKAIQSFAEKSLKEGHAAC